MLSLNSVFFYYLYNRFLNIRKIGHKDMKLLIGLLELLICLRHLHSVLATKTFFLVLALSETETNITPLKDLSTTKQWTSTSICFHVLGTSIFANFFHLFLKKPSFITIKMGYPYLHKIKIHPLLPLLRLLWAILWGLCDLNFALSNIQIIR